MSSKSVKSRKNGDKGKKSKNDNNIKHTVVIITVDGCHPCSVFKQTYDQSVQDAINKRKDLILFRYNITTKEPFNTPNGSQELRNVLNQINPILPSFVTFFPHIGLYNTDNIRDTTRKTMGVIFNSIRETVVTQDGREVSNIRALGGRDGKPTDPPALIPDASNILAWVDRQLKQHHGVFYGPIEPASVQRNISPTNTDVSSYGRINIPGVPSNGLSSNRNFAILPGSSSGNQNGDGSNGRLPIMFSGQKPPYGGYIVADDDDDPFNPTSELEGNILHDLW
jgi:hypothetical protein